VREAGRRHSLQGVGASSDDMGLRTRKGKARAPPPTRKVTVLENLEIELRPFKDLGFKPLDVIVGISSEGTVGPLVAAQLIQHLGLDQVCAIESPNFPPTAMVYFEKPKFPARIYASKKHRLAVVLAEFAPSDELARPLAYAILAWCEEQGAKRIFGIDSFPPQLASPEGVALAAIGSTARDRRAIAEAKVNGVKHGAVTGVAGVLLNEGRWWDRDTIVLMASLAGSDLAAALHTLAALNRLVPRLPLTKARAGKEDTELEKAIRAAHARESTHEYI
jgi:predicted ATP-grasp superfamily ATP-dependent carboligase